MKQITGPPEIVLLRNDQRVFEKLEKAKIIKDISHETAKQKKKPTFSLNVENGTLTQLEDITQNISLFISQR